MKGEKCPFAHNIPQDVTEIIVGVEVFDRIEIRGTRKC